MLEQIFNSIPAAEVGIAIGSFALGTGAIGTYQGFASMGKKGATIGQRFSSFAVGTVSLVAAAAGPFVALEAHNQIKDLTRGAPVSGTVNDFPLAPEPETAPSTHP